MLVLVPLFMIIQFVFAQGASSLNLSFFTELPKPVGEIGGGMKHAIFGTIYIVLLGALIAVPIGVTCGIYLSEFNKSKLSKTLKITVDLMSASEVAIRDFFMDVAQFRSQRHRLP
jgi:phosphate transport system permease protein